MKTQLNQQHQEPKSWEGVSRIVLTNAKVYSKQRAKKLFGEYLSKNNLPILLDHICIESLAEYINAFFEDDGVLVLELTNGEHLRVIINSENNIINN